MTVADTRSARTQELAASLAPPSGVVPRQIDWIYAVPVVAYHVVALLALVPWFFSWTGVVLAVLGLYVFGTLGINLCYHRVLVHRGLVVPKWLEHTFAILGVCCVQDTPARWVAVHRRHHQHADEQDDPHSPLVNFFWGHMGWVLVENRDLRRLRIYEKYARDVLQDRFRITAWPIRDRKRGCLESIKESATGWFGTSRGRETQTLGQGIHGR